MKNYQKEPLFRKVNTKARGCHHKRGGDYSRERGTKNPQEKMKQGVARGLDYTPLFKFLLSKVGQDWDKVHSEAVSRLDRNTEAISWILDPSRDFFRVENAYFNTLKVDENNLLQKVNPTLSVTDFAPDCHCCTHSFNGKAIPN